MLVGLHFASEAGVDKPKEKSSKKGSNEVGSDSGEDADGTPDQDTTRQVDTRSSGILYKHVGWNLHLREVTALLAMPCDHLAMNTSSATKT